MRPHRHLHRAHAHACTCARDCIQYVNSMWKAHTVEPRVAVPRLSQGATPVTQLQLSSCSYPVAVSQLQLSSCSYPVAGIHAQNTDTALLSTDCGHQVRIFGYPILYCIPILYDQYMRTRVHTVPVWTDSHCTCTCTYMYKLYVYLGTRYGIQVPLYSTKSPY